MIVASIAFCTYMYIIYNTLYYSDELVDQVCLFCVNACLSVIVAVWQVPT